MTPKFTEEMKKLAETPSKSSKWSCRRLDKSQTSTMLKLDSERGQESISRMERRKVTTPKNFMQQRSTSKASS